MPFSSDHSLLSHKVLINQMPGSKIPLISTVTAGETYCKTLKPVSCSLQLWQVIICVLLFKSKEFQFDASSFTLPSSVMTSFLETSGALINPWRHCNINARQM